MVETFKICETGADKQKQAQRAGKADEMKARNGDPEPTECKHYVSRFLKRFKAPLPLTSTMTRRKQADTPLLPLLRPVVYEAAEVENGSQATQIRSQQGSIHRGGYSWRAD